MKPDGLVVLCLQDLKHPSSHFHQTPLMPICLSYPMLYCSPYAVARVSEGPYAESTFIDIRIDLSRGVCGEGKDMSRSMNRGCKMHKVRIHLGKQLNLSYEAHLRPIPCPFLDICPSCYAGHQHDADLKSLPLQSVPQPGPPPCTVVDASEAQHADD